MSKETIFQTIFHPPKLIWFLDFDLKKVSEWKYDAGNRHRDPLLLVRHKSTDTHYVKYSHDSDCDVLDGNFWWGEPDMYYIDDEEIQECHGGDDVLW